MLKALSVNKTVRNLYKYSVKRTMGLTALISVFTLLICPAYLLIDINSRTKYNTYQNSAFYSFDFSKNIPSYIMVISIVTTATALLYLFINFSFLYSRNASDLFHSLPTKRSGLFTARLLGAITPILIPLVLVYGSMALISVFAVNDGNLRLVLTGFLFNLLIIITCSAFSTVFIICSGSVLDLLISFATFNIGVLVLRYIAVDLCDSMLLGFASTEEVEFLMSSSPVFYAFSALYGVMTGDVFANETVLKVIIKLLLTTAVSLTAAYLLYNRRKSEKSGVSYAYKFIYYICTVIIGIIGAYLLGSIFAEGEKESPIFWIFAIIGGPLAAITFAAINERSFKNVKKPLIMGSSATIILIVSSLILFNGGFGYTNRIPKKEDIQYARVSFNDFSAEFSNPETVLNLHNEIINGDLSKHINYIRFNYTLKNGKTFYRGFFVDNDDYKDSLLAVYKSEEHLKEIEKNLSAFSPNGVSTSISLELGSEYISEVYLTPTELDAIKTAYLKDIKNATFDSIDKSSKIFAEGNLHGYTNDGKYWHQELRIEKTFENTITILNDMNLKERSEVIIK